MGKKKINNPGLYISLIHMSHMMCLLWYSLLIFLHKNKIKSKVEFRMKLNAETDKFDKYVIFWCVVIVSNNRFPFFFYIPEDCIATINVYSFSLMNTLNPVWLSSIIWKIETLTKIYYECLWCAMYNGAKRFATILTA